MSDLDTYKELVTTKKATLWRAILAVQGAVHGVKRDAKNSHFKNSYATIEAVWRTLRQPLQDAGLAVVQMPGALKDGAITITTIVAHADSGETLRSDLSVPVTKPDAQGVGSAITYGCRYSLMAMFSLPPTDDDGEAARIDNGREVVRYAPNGKPVPTLERALNDCADSVAEIKKALENNDDEYALQCWSEIEDHYKMALWVAPTKHRDAPFTTDERTRIKTTKANAA